MKNNKAEIILNYFENLERLRFYKELIHIEEVMSLYIKNRKHQENIKSPQLITDVTNTKGDFRV